MVGLEDIDAPCCFAGSGAERSLVKGISQAGIFGAGALVSPPELAAGAAWTWKAPP